ncbi:vitamin D3 hydroxylase-associated protein-like [Dromaius novaehollandiae]|uniref:vitamin D3 hydroxylase-associated protein-like n=1 Tax=Dromaius novaehollandiae TaxID=8790 RepID=UPI00311E3090
MICEKVKQLLSGFGDNPCSVPVLVCSSTAALMALTWAVKKLMKRKVVRAKHHAEALEQMEKAVQQFKKENPDVQSSHILSLPLTELVEKLREGSLSPESVLYSYIEKALEVNQEVNCVTAFIPSCLHHIWEMRNRKKGLLYGVPISVKDHVACKGYGCVCGSGQKLSLPEQEESVLMKVLRSQGAIPFVKTNTAQCMISYDCSNAVYGQTLNPLNHKKSPGGCSGGEGALIAGGGSILGIGLDVGGSICLLSSFCGLCGLKPTSDRLSYWGVSGPVHPLQTAAGVVGPIARDVDSLALCMRALLCEDMFCLDPTVPPIPFNMEVFSSPAPLRIGFYSLDSYFLLPPCVTRAVHETRLLLEEAGHTMIPFVPPSVDYAMNSLFVKGLFADSGSDSAYMCKLDSLELGCSHPILCDGLPTALRKILACLIKPLFPCFASYLDMPCGVRSSKELADLHTAMMVYRWEFITRWKNLDLDVVLCPVLGPAFTLGYSETNVDGLSSTMLYNILNFPAGVVPVTMVTEADEEQLQLYSRYLDEPWDKKLRKAVEGAVGLPVAVQCVALPWQEELCLRFMKEVERLTCEKKQRTDASGANKAQRHGLSQALLGAASVAQQSQKSSSTLPDVSSMTSKAEECPTLQRTALQITLAGELWDDVQTVALQPDMKSDRQILSSQPETSTPVSWPEMQSDVQMLSSQPDVATMVSWSDEESEGPILIHPPDMKRDLQPCEPKPDVPTQAPRRDGERDPQPGEPERDVQAQAPQSDEERDPQPGEPECDVQAQAPHRDEERDPQPHVPELDVRTQAPQRDEERDPQPGEPERDVQAQAPQSDEEGDPQPGEPELDVQTQAAEGDMSSEDQSQPITQVKLTAL